MSTRRKKKNNNSTVSSDILCSNFSSTDAEMKPAVPWAELPCIAVEKIYSHLNREDQRNMSMVCRNWNKEYSYPGFWRKFEFLIPERDLNLEVYPEVQFARKYGDMFHHVEIVWPEIILFQYIEPIWKQVKLFLEALTHAQLETVTFQNMEKYVRYQDDTISDDVYQTVKIFFSSQHELKTVNFSYACFKKSEAAEILRVIFLNSKSLRNIRLDTFWIPLIEQEFDEIAYNVGNEALTFESFLNIKTLQLDYSQIFENILITFYEYTQNSDSRRMKGNLELIKIFCHGSEELNCRGIPPECWKLFTQICPSLRINLTFQIEVRIKNSIDLFVVRNMPLKVLNFKWHRCQAGSETEIGVLFRHLQSCRTNEYLEDLSIVWHRNMNNLAIDLINFLQTCKTLKILKLYIEHPIDSLDIVFISWLENRPPSLQNVFITVKNVHSQKAAAIYSNMADKYCPLLQIRSLNLRLIVDSETRKRKR